MKHIFPSGNFTHPESALPTSYPCHCLRWHYTQYRTCTNELTFISSNQEFESTLISHSFLNMFSLTPMNTHFSLVLKHYSLLLSLSLFLFFFSLSLSFYLSLSLFFLTLIISLLYFNPTSVSISIYLSNSIFSTQFPLPTAFFVPHKMWSGVIRTEAVSSEIETKGDFLWKRLKKKKKEEMKAEVFEWEFESPEKWGKWGWNRI